MTAGVGIEPRGAALFLALALAASAAPYARALADSGDSSPAPEPAALSAHEPPSAPSTRPLRNAVLSVPSWRHHAGPERYGLSMPFGEPQFERYRSLYLSDGGKAWIKAVYRRSEPYAAYILERIRFYGVPEELFFLPFIESEYLPRAVSKSGATGLWQFMRNSIAGYGMRIDEWSDERRDFMKSTDGALRKLVWNYERFGDWLLAIAAYNCGAGAMDRAIAAAGGKADYWTLREKKLLPAETLSYIPKFLAVAWVGMHAGRNGIDLGWTVPRQWVALKVDRPIDLGMLGEALGTDPEELRRGNPEFLYGITSPDRSSMVKVPAELSGEAAAILASADRLMNVYVHTVRSGDTVSALAKHYGVSIALIAKLNRGLDPDRIRIGQSIAIPALKDVGPYAATVKAHDELVYGGSYVVKRGDTLWSISLAYGVQPEALADKNGLSMNSVLREGSVLNVPILN